ncbi:MAG TPA: tetratricopeptide repeat protein, partial [Pyrinomonadaceae bacterium]|nr:tetratricopeptide repeat protein [Pyrinomonadaceae bacterium]
MKLSQSRTTLLLLVLLVAWASAGCGMVNSIRAKNQLNEGARAYKAGRFAEAQQHFEESLRLNPEQKNAKFFIARSIHAQYRPGVEAPENVARAKRAITAYEEVLKSEQANDEAYNAVIYLFNQLKDEQQARQWLTARAEMDSIPGEKRSQAYTLMASKEWNCSYTITEQKDNKQTVMKDNKAIIQYKQTKEQAAFHKAMNCVNDGMARAERAVSLDPNSEQAWSYKTNLLLEHVKLAEMEGNNDKKAEYQKQASAAQQKTSQ